MKHDKLSATAHLIARGIVFISRDPKFGYLVSSLSAQASIWFMEASSAHARWLLSAMDRRWFRSLAFLTERLTIPGILLHYVLRKRYLEDVARSSLNEGFDQVVILGAGFDTLALRLHEEFHKVLFFELDHSATQRIKTKALESRGLLKKNIKFIPIDFTQETLEEGYLAYKEYTPQANTLFIAEGLLMYLETRDVDSIFRFISEHSERKSRFAFTFMEPQADGKVNFQNSSKAVDLWLRVRGEIFKWGIKRHDLSNYLESRGFLLQELATPETFRRRYLAESGLVDVVFAQGEYVCVAERL